jgi:hypothetical protein
VLQVDGYAGFERLTAPGPELSWKSDSAPTSIEDVERVVIARDHLLISTVGSVDGDGTNQEFKIPWSTKVKDARAAMEDNGVPEVAPHESLIQSIVRAHVWVDRLHDGTY